MSNDVFRLHWKIFLGVSAFVGLFAFIYEQFSHGVVSKPMVYAFVYPLAMGFLPALIFSLFKRLKEVPYASLLRFGVNIYVSGVATLTMGSVAKGVVEIYGTTNRLIKYYEIAGWPLAVIGAFIALTGLVSGLNAAEESNG